MLLLFGLSYIYTSSGCCYQGKTYTDLFQTSPFNKTYWVHHIVLIVFNVAKFIFSFLYNFFDITTVIDWQASVKFCSNIPHHALSFDVLPLPDMFDWPAIIKELSKEHYITYVLEGLTFDTVFAPL